MKETTRSLLEMSIDEMLADEKIQRDMLDFIGLFEDEVSDTSLKERVLGFVMGILYFNSASILGVTEIKMPMRDSKKAEIEVLEIIRKRIPKIMNTIKDIQKDHSLQ
jgi:hypothetical protein